MDPLKPNVTKTNGIHLEIAILSGRFLCPDMNNTSRQGIAPCNTFVKLEIFGCTADRSFGDTEVFVYNAFNPVWLENFDFGWIHVPSLAVLRISVYIGQEKTYDLLCQTTMPVEHLRKGYRYVAFVTKLFF